MERRWRGAKGDVVMKRVVVVMVGIGERRRGAKGRRRGRRVVAMVAVGVVVVDVVCETPEGGRRVGVEPGIGVRQWQGMEILRSPPKVAYLGYSSKVSTWHFRADRLTFVLPPLARNFVKDPTPRCATLLRSCHSHDSDWRCTSRGRFDRKTVTCSNIKLHATYQCAPPLMEYGEEKRARTCIRECRAVVEAVLHGTVIHSLTIRTDRCNPLMLRQ